MKQVSIVNKFDGSFGQKFNDDVKQQAWIDGCIAKNSWGLPERIVNKEPVDYDLEDVTEEIDAVTHEEEVIDYEQIDIVDALLAIVDGKIVLVETGEEVKEWEVDGNKYVLEIITHFEQEPKIIGRRETGSHTVVVVDAVAKVRLACQYTITIVNLDEDADYQLEKEIRKAQHRMSVCKFVIERVSARNKIVGMTAEQMGIFLAAFEDIIKLLQVGQLDMARAAIAAVEPIGNITQEELNLIVAICDAGLAKEAEIE